MATTSTPDLAKLSVSELRQLSRNIDKEVEIRRQKERDKAYEQIREIAASAGLSLTDIANRKGRKSRARVKYRDPKDPGNTWAGRGRKPKWLEEELANGRRLEEFAV